MSDVIILVLLFLLAVSLSYGFTVGIVYLICLCFDLEFSILIASGIWLLICLLRSVFK